jgi:predicted secreted protein
MFTDSTIVANGKVTCHNGLEVSGNLDISGSIDVYWDETDTAQIALTVGSTVTLKVYPEGTASASKYYSGEAIVTGVSRSASFDGLVEASISVQGTGVLTLATA